jgi:hypothetical protein
MKRIIKWLLVPAPFALLAVTGWLAYPTGSPQDPPSPLIAATPASLVASQYEPKTTALVKAFEPQTYLSFCGPASIATVLRAIGVKDADQRHIFSSVGRKAQTFYGGVNLAQLSRLATEAGLLNKPVRADELSIEQFKQVIVESLTANNHYVLVNYHRPVLGQSGGGHISPIASYDAKTDAFLILDEAGYRYPFTWIPADQLYRATKTLDGDHYRGLLLIDGYKALDNVP